MTTSLLSRVNLWPISAMKAAVAARCLAAAAAEGWPEAATMAAPVAVLAADFTQVVLARLMLGVPPWIGDRRHLTHIAMSLGAPRVAVAPLFAALAAQGFWVLASA